MPNPLTVAAGKAMDKRATDRSRQLEGYQHTTINESAYRWDFHAGLMENVAQFVQLRRYPKRRLTINCSHRNIRRRR